MGAVPVVTALAVLWSMRGEGDHDSCRRMLRAQRIYAPDGRALVHADGAVFLGVCLNHLLPEDAYDRGPVIDERGRVLIADIRIDNRGDLCRALGISLADVKEMTDCKLLSLALVRWDIDALQHVVGDYAFCLWDPTRQVLLLARDFLGQRPLHYILEEGFFAASSMPKGLHALPEVSRAPNLEAAAAFSAFWPEVRDESFFAGVKKVAPGHAVVIDTKGLTTRRYWNPSLVPMQLSRDEDYVDALREQLDVAVAARLRGASGSVAAHLSGGLDSSNVAASAAIQLAGKGSVLAFTSVPRPDLISKMPGIADEGPLATAIAEMYPNMENILIHAGTGSPLDALARNMILYERPILNLCNTVWIDAINDAVRSRGAKILLTGSLGNAAFSSNGMPLLAELLAQRRILRLAANVKNLLRNGIAPSTIAAAAAGPLLPQTIRNAINRARAPFRKTYRRISPPPHMRRTERRPPPSVLGTQLWMLGWVDVGNYVKGTLGGWGIDRRDPTGDRRLVELCLRMPAEQFLRQGVRRSLARRVGVGRLPEAVVREERKGNQSADWFDGMRAAREQFVAEVDALSTFQPAANVIDVKRLMLMAKAWPQNDWDSRTVAVRYREGALRDISLGHFMRLAAEPS